MINGGDLLIGMDGEFNLTKWNSECALLNQRVCRIRSKSPLLLDDYLQYFLPPTLRKIENRTSYVTVKHLSAKVLNAVDIPLVSVEEQQRISLQFKTIDQLIEESERSVTRLDALVKSRFVEMFNDHCARVKLSEICDTYNGDRGKNYPSEKDRVEKGIPFVNASHLSAGKVSFENMDYITEERYALLSGGKISRDDILYCLRGSLGKCAIADFECGAIASSMMLIRPDQKKILPAFLYQALISPEVTKQLGAARNGSTQPNLSAKSVRNYLVSLPNLDSQRKFVAFTRQIDKFRFAGNHEMNFRCERFTLSWSTMA